MNFTQNLYEGEVEESITHQVNENFDRLLSSLLQKVNFHPHCREARNILIVIHGISNGGSERATTLLANALVDIVETVTVLTFSKDQQEYQLSPSIKRYNTPREKFRSVETIRLLRLLQIDTIIFEDHWIEETMKDILWARMLNFNVIIQEHATFLYPLYTGQVDLMLLRKDAYRFASAVTCLSEMDKFFWLSSGINATYLPNFLTFDHDKVGKVTFCDRELAVAVVGRQSFLKGLDRLPTLISNVVNRLPGVKFYICGNFVSEFEKRWFISELKRLNITNNVICRGFCSNVAEIIQKARVHLLPSLIEGSPMVILEARSLRTPTVLFDMEYIDSTRHGCLCLSSKNLELAAEKISQLLTHEDVWIELSDDTQVDLLKWSDNTIKAKWRSLFSSLGKEIAVNSDQRGRPDYLALQELYRAINVTFRKEKLPETYYVFINLVQKLCPQGSLRYKAARCIYHAVGRLFLR